MILLNAYASRLHLLYVILPGYRLKNYARSQTWEIILLKCKVGGTERMCVLITDALL